jgi:hypothetical protein
LAASRAASQLHKQPLSFFRRKLHQQAQLLNMSLLLLLFVQLSLLVQLTQKVSGCITVLFHFISLRHCTAICFIPTIKGEQNSL